MKTYYLFDAVTGESAGIYQAQPSPLEAGVYISPVHSTDIAPPASVAGQVAVFANGVWTMQPDFRGQSWYDAKGNAVLISVIGTPPNTLTSTLSAAILLSNAKKDQNTALTNSCAAAIVSGFTSSALGAAHIYPTQPADQTNLIGAVASGLATINFWCADSAGVWSFASHTAAQIKQVMADGGAQRMAYSAKLAGLAAQVTDATTVAAVQAVVW